MQKRAEVMGHSRLAFLIITFIFFLSILSSVSALKLECLNDGSFKISGSYSKSPIYYKDKAGQFKEAEGQWLTNKLGTLPTYDFYSDEGIFISKTAAKQYVKLGNSQYTISCPAFSFSCRILNISIDYCYTLNGWFNTKFTAYNFDLDKNSTLRFDKPLLLQYDLNSAESRKIFTHSPTVVSASFEKINLTMRKLAKENKFLFKWPALEKIKSMEIRYDKCSQKKFTFFVSRLCLELKICDIDKDCEGDEQCQNKTCQKIEPGECQYAADHTIFDYECCEDAACPAEKFCDEKNTCQSLSCAEEEGIVEHQCQTLECAEDELIFDHTCRKLQCQDNEKTENHQCVILQCGEKETAANHSCQPLICRWFEKAKEQQCRPYLNFLSKVFK